MEDIISDALKALLRIGERVSDGFRWKAMVNLESPLIVNRLRRDS
ncbi:MAG: hypothetical protein NZ959_09390 [Armatimonadetes bacterium]|nr:hypothetical protein [Armatimonadota bacterium]MDW8122200.1 hypothetical protein [Armatimonadota bacterium]